jgi:U3 small nucleolar RNA-associated protein 13
LVAQVRVLSLSTHDCAVLTGHTAIVLCVDVSRDGEHIVTSSKDGDVRIWRVVRGDRRGAMRFECVGRGVGHTEGVGAVAFSRKSTSFAVSGGQDRTVKLWDTEAAIGVWCRGQGML